MVCIDIHLLLITFRSSKFDFPFFHVVLIPNLNNLVLFLVQQGVRPENTCKILFKGDKIAQTEH